MNLDIPRKFHSLIEQARQVANEVFRPISRKYDKLEHHYPVELDMLASIMDGMSHGTSLVHFGADKLSRQKSSEREANVNGANMVTVLGLQELCRGDVALALSIPRQGLGNAALAALATPEQLRQFGHYWTAMAITEPGAGSDAANISTTAVLEGDEYVLNGEKIFVTAGQRCEAVVVWATLDKTRGRAAIKSFFVPKTAPGVVVERLERKLGIKASDTATIRFTECRIPKSHLLGSPDIEPEKSFAGAMQTFDNTRPVVAAMAVGLATASLERTRKLLAEAGLKMDYEQPSLLSSAVVNELYQMEAELESVRLLTLKAAWMADNNRPNSKEASMAKARAAEVANRITMRCVTLCGSVGYLEDELLEKWARDSKILDIFEGTQQIQQLIIARRLLNKSSRELK